MAKPRHYSPLISRQLVQVLYYERKRRGIPMTRLVDEILVNALQGTESWRVSEETTQYKYPGRTPFSRFTKPAQTARPQAGLFRAQK